MKMLVAKSAAMLLATVAVCLGQTDTRAVIAYLPKQTARIQHIKLPPAPNAEVNGSLTSLLQAVVNDSEVCCGKDSALQHDVELLNTTSLQAVNDKLKGRHVMRDGRWVTIDAEYLAEPAINSAILIRYVLQDQMTLLEWNAHVYLVKSIAFDQTQYSDGTNDYVIQGMTLLDPQSKTKNKEVVFDRQKDAWGNIKGLLILTAQKD